MLPVTDWLHERLLCIPLYSDLPDVRIDAVAQLISASSIRASAEQEAARIRAIGLIPKCGHAAVRLECFFVDGCVDPSSSSSSAFNSARHAGGSQRQSVRRSLPSPPACVQDLFPPTRNDGSPQLEHRLRVRLLPEEARPLQPEVDQPPDRALIAPLPSGTPRHRKQSYRNRPAAECRVK